MSIVDHVTWRGRAYRLVWEPDAAPAGVAFTQASAVCVKAEGSIVLVAGAAGGWGLPGGRPEPDESLEEALRRDVWEEGCAVVTHAEYLGAQRVEDPAGEPAHYQARFWARVALEPFVARFETAGRVLVPPPAFASTLAWGTSPIAAALLDAALAADRRHRDRQRVAAAGETDGA